MRMYRLGLGVTLALAIAMPAARAQNQNHQQDGVPALDHVFVIVLENHNSFRSFGSNGIIGNPQAPNLTALWNKYNVATNYNGVWHPSPEGLREISRLAAFAGTRKRHLVRQIAHDVLQAPRAPAVVIANPSPALTNYLQERGGRFPGFKVAVAASRSYPLGAYGGTIHLSLVIFPDASAV